MFPGDVQDGCVKFHVDSPNVKIGNFPVRVCRKFKVFPSPIRRRNAQNFQSQLGTLAEVSVNFSVFLFPRLFEVAILLS